MPRPPLARRNSGFALATAASKSFSVPAFTSIWAISVTIGFSPFRFLMPVFSRASKKEKGRSRNARRSAEEEDRARDHHRAADEHDDRPKAALRTVAALRTPLGDQSRLILFGGREHAGETAARRGGRGFERTQNGLRIAPADRLHGLKTTDRMV